jgi:hypothetical protein
MIVDEDADTVLMLHRYRLPTDQWGYELLGLVEDGRGGPDRVGAADPSPGAGEARRAARQ